MSRQFWADAATINCVWLFQTACYEYNIEGSQYRYDEDFEEFFEGDRRVDRQELIDNDVCSKHWHSSKVFLTRAEGIDYGFRRHYDYGKYGEDWRLYGVPACGIMPEKLADAGIDQDYIDKRIPAAERLVQEWQEILTVKHGEKNG